MHQKGTLEKVLLEYPGSQKENDPMTKMLARHLSSTEKTQTIQRKKKEEWETEAGKEQYKLNVKNYFNLTKKSEEQANSIAALGLQIQTFESQIKKLENSSGHWKYIAVGILVLASIEFSILLKFIL